MISIYLPRRVVIFILTCSLFVLSQFYRVSVAVITPNLMTDLALSTKSLSLMSASFFYAFALTQIPIGIYLDRIGPRLTMACLSMVAVAGGLVFAWADSAGDLIFGRLLLGIGMACNLMGTFKLLTLWFDPFRFATLTALVVSFGTAGNMAATTPLVLLVQAFGWRITFSLISFVNLLLVILFFLIVRDRPDPQPHPVEMPASSGNLRATFVDIFNLFRKRDYWIISWGTFCRYGVFAAIQALWAGPYLFSVMQLSQVKAGNMLFLLSLGVILGGPFCGMLSDRVFKTRKWIVIPGLLGMASTLIVLAFLPAATPLIILAALFFLFGVVSSVGGIMYPHIKELMPIEKAGTAMTGINFFTMTGAAVFLQGLGNIMQVVYPGAAMGAGAFKVAFLLCAFFLLSVGLFYLATKDTHGQFEDR